MTLKQLCKQAHKIAIEKGFWTDDSKFKKGKASSKISRNNSELLMLIVSELGEACEALRKGDRQASASLSGKKIDLDWRKDTFEDEIADTFIRLGDMCEALNIDIEWQIKQKMAYNKTRPRKHGKQF